jgi:hypothetical protein
MEKEKAGFHKSTKKYAFFEINNATIYSYSS